MNGDAWHLAMRRLAFMALTVFVFSQPWEGGVRTFASGSISRYLGLLAMLIGLIAVLSRGSLRLRPLSLFLLLALVFTFLGGLSTFWSINPMVSVSSTVKYVQLVAMVWLIHEFARERSQRDVLMQAYVLGGIVALGFAIFTFFTGGGYRDVGTANANDAAMYLAIGIPMATSLLLRSRQRWSLIVNGLYIPGVLFFDVLAASRGGLLASLVGLMSLPVLLAQLRWTHRVGLALALVVGGWFVYGLAPRVAPDLGANLGRLAETTEELESGTLTNRRLIWSAGLEVFKDKPVAGVGLGAYRYAVEGIYGVAAASHNSFLGVLVNLGIIGFAVWLAMVAVAVLPGVLGATTGANRWFLLVFAATLFVGIAPLEVQDRKQVWFALTMLAMQRSIMIRGRSSLGDVPPVKGRLGRLATTGEQA